MAKEATGGRAGAGQPTEAERKPGQGGEVQGGKRRVAGDGRSESDDKKPMKVLTSTEEWVCKTSLVEVAKEIDLIRDDRDRVKKERDAILLKSNQQADMIANMMASKRTISEPQVASAIIKAAEMLESIDKRLMSIGSCVTNAPDYGTGAIVTASKHNHVIQP
jgi:hypothetical protein